VQLEIDFVIVSYECNFWALAALEALVDALETAGFERNIYVIHSFKSTAKINHFRTYCRSLQRQDRLHQVTAYHGVFEQVENFADHTRNDNHWLLARHGLVLNWLIKYFLPAGRYVFLDHDCLVRPQFASALAEMTNDLDGKLFVFPRHDDLPKSLTAPMFYCDTAVRPLIADLCDVGWVSGVVCGERDRLQGGREVFYTDAEFERAISRNHFDDTLHNVVRHLLARSPGIVSRLAAVRWPECDHLWHAGTHHLRRFQVHLLRRWIDEYFEPAHFLVDNGNSALLEGLLERLRDCGMEPFFRDRLLSNPETLPSPQGVEACP
jgi:hypothetical protein